LGNIWIVAHWLYAVMRHKRIINGASGPPARRRTRFGRWAACLNIIVLMVSPRPFAIFPKTLGKRHKALAARIA
jgi:hypothetical protein